MKFLPNHWKNLKGAFLNTTSSALVAAYWFLLVFFVLGRFLLWATGILWWLGAVTANAAVCVVFGSLWLSLVAYGWRQAPWRWFSVLVCGYHLLVFLATLVATLRAISGPLPLDQPSELSGYRYVLLSLLTTVFLVLLLVSHMGFPRVLHWAHKPDYIKEETVEYLCARGDDRLSDWATLWADSMTTPGKIMEFTRFLTLFLENLWPMIRALVMVYCIFWSQDLRWFLALAAPHLLVYWAKIILRYLVLTLERDLNYLSTLLRARPVREDFWQRQTTAGVVQLSGENPLTFSFTELGLSLYPQAKHLEPLARHWLSLAQANQHWSELDRQRNDTFWAWLSLLCLVLRYVCWLTLVDQVVLDPGPLVLGGLLNMFTKPPKVSPYSSRFFATKTQAVRVHKKSEPDLEVQSKGIFKRGHFALTDTS